MTPEDHVWALEVTFFGEHRWTSVHSTPEGARARLEQKVDEFEVRDSYEAEARCESTSETSIASEQDGDMVTWTISRRPVEP
jgi:hypothetical protein